MNPPLLPHQQRNRLLIAGGFCLLLVFLVWLPKNAVLPLPPCPFHHLTGLPCPLCGGTRSAQAILHAEWGRALYLNPLAYTAIALMVAIAGVLVLEAARRRSMVDWTALAHRLHKGMPFLFGLLLGWWGAHIVFSLSKPKTELVDLRNPIAKAAYQYVSGRLPATTN